MGWVVGKKRGDEGLKFELEILDSGIPVKKVFYNLKLSKKAYHKVFDRVQKVFSLEFRSNLYFDASTIFHSPLYKLYRKMNRENPKNKCDFEYFLSVINLDYDLLTYCFNDFYKKRSYMDTIFQMKQIFIMKKEGNNG